MRRTPRPRALFWMIFSATVTTVGAVACSHGWDGYDPRLGTASASGTGGGASQSATAAESASSTSVTSAASSTTSTTSTTSGAGGAGGADAGPPTYRDLVLAEAPLAYWRLGDKQGQDIVDEVGQHPGTATSKGLSYGMPGLIAGDTALGFDGISGGISVPGGWDFAGQSPYSFELWIKLAPATNAYPRVISKEATTNPRNGYLMLAGAPVDGGSPFIGSERWENGVDLLAVYYHGTVSASDWTYVVARFDGTEGAMVVNGVVAGSYKTDPDAGLIVNPATLTIGSLPNQGSRFAGQLDEIAIYGKALSDVVIANHYKAGLAGL